MSHFVFDEGESVELLADQVKYATALIDAYSVTGEPERGHTC